MAIEQKCGTKGIELIDITQSGLKYFNFEFTIKNHKYSISEYIHNMYSPDFPRIRDAEGHICCDLEIDILKFLALTEAKDINRTSGVILIDLDIKPQDIIEPFAIPTGAIFGAKYARDDFFAITSRNNTVLKDIGQYIKQYLQNQYFEQLDRGCVMCKAIEIAIKNFEQQTPENILWSLASDDGVVYFSYLRSKVEQRTDTDWFKGEQKHYYNNNELLEIDTALRNDCIILGDIE